MNKKQKKANKATPKTKQAARPKTVSKAGFYSNPKSIQPEFIDKVRNLETQMKRPVLLLWHGNRSKDKYAYLDDVNYLLFAKNIRKLKEGKKVVVVINSPGGDARSAFKLACLLRKHCGGFTAVVPYLAKSAATLFALGADKIIISRFAELGPLDAQIVDIEREERLSALEVVQAIERLNSEAMRAVDQQMLFWLGRTGKKVETLLPIATHFVSEMMRPLFEKIDTVNYTGMARILKVGQDYAQRLLEKTGLDTTEAAGIADKLTNAYSEHGYVLDYDELRRAGIKNAQEATGNVASILEEMVFMELNSIMLGPLEEVQDNE